MQNKGRYNEDFSTAPTKAKGESEAAYGARLKEWQRKRSRSGSKPPTQAPAKGGEKRMPRATELPLHSNPGGWMDKVVRALK